ncbi:acyl carrier protein [Streptosporangium sp. NBC_01495]|uniref:acyl carrier protein n=1 Tax=Streptosporangium sp. NBC_01495 TaxID=2903899 RepID=UPI002E3008EF|nr:acyl carrier protein [Streptosporangium sp. NBC_01495]
MPGIQETTEIEQTVRSILVTDLFVEVPEIGLDDGLRGIVGLDSLGFVELRVQCEDRFGVRISEKEFSPENFASIRSISELVRRLQTGPAASGDRDVTADRTPGGERSDAG